MAVSLGTPTIAHATALANQQKIVKTSIGTLVAIFTTENGLQYKTSTDNGDNWSGFTTIDASDSISDIFIDDSNNIYVAYNSYVNAINTYFRKLTYTGVDTWSVGAQKTILTDYFNYHSWVTITQRANGDLWVSMSRTSGSPTTIDMAYSTDSGDTWLAADAIGLGVNQWSRSCKLIPFGANIMAIYSHRAGNIYSVIYTASWSAETLISTGITDDNINLGAVKISDTEIWCAGRTAAGIKAFKYNGSTWSAGTLISDNANDSSPFCANVGGAVMIGWRDYDGTNYNIVYRKYVSGSWLDPINFTNDADVDNFPSGCMSDANFLYLLWTTGAGSPYTVYFDCKPTSQSILSDAKLVDHYIKTILSDAKLVEHQTKTILSDANIVTLVLSNINNYFNNAIRTFSNINNYFNSVIRVLSDTNNFVNTCVRVFNDTLNDFRTQKRVINDINNDIRFLASWMNPIGFQSKGKAYIRVYIATVEQTDVDVDSVIINRVKNEASTASFILGRAYDSTKPVSESLVEIKYDNWTIYKGYITAITPSEEPESMRVECKDKYWKDNKINKYYHVGHKPNDNTERYYSTIKEALLTEHGWSLSAGNFIPQTIDCFADGQADCISQLLDQAGNFGWFYDVNEAKILWEAGAGSVINLHRQELGTNIALYDVISHSFDESVTDIINKYRVQMGNKVIRTTGSRQYTASNYASYHQYVTSAWDGAYEILAKNSGSGYGIDYPADGTEENYKDVFRKFNMPYLNPNLSSWSDVYAPYVEIYGTGWQIFNSVVGVLKDGFTIDYENQTITFNDPIFLYNKDANGEITNVRAPLVKVFLWKKNYYTYTVDPSNDPESLVTNPLLFFTSKMGSYADTIIKDLNLSSLSIQTGTTYYSAGSTEEGQTYGGGSQVFTMGQSGLTSMHIYLNGTTLASSNYTYVSETGKVTVIPALNLGDFLYFSYSFDGTHTIPSWDDTAFAADFADWKLTKTCDKKITGTIDITLDAYCFYGLDLNKRIFISGITDTSMNITDINIKMNNFTVTLTLENSRAYTRTVSLQSREE
jgi:hypothetical protein